MSSMRFAESPTALLIGNDFGDGRPVYWHDSRSLITVGPSGCGKTRGHVFTNLARWPGSAVVLDIKGECHRETAHLRERFGRVIRFDPEETDRSARYNPLAAVRRDERFIWEDARTVAEALVKTPPGAGSHEFWYSNARDMVQLCVAYACWTQTDQNPATLYRVLELVATFGSEHDDAIQLEDFTASRPEPGEAAYPVEFRFAALQFQTLLDSRKVETFGGIATQARTALAPFMGGSLSRVLSGSDWAPADLREPGTTLYLCVPDTRVAELSGLLRLMIGQHVSGLMGRENEGASSQVLFFLDEVAQLGRMDPILKALEVGRGYGVRLWLLVQTLAQLRSANAYGHEDAETVLANCALKAFMNPDPASAAELSRWVGERPDPFGTERRPVVTPQDLSGDAWADRLLVFVSGEQPHRLGKATWSGLG